MERADQDATIAKALLKIFEKALAIHVADRDRLAKRLADSAGTADEQIDLAFRTVLARPPSASELDTCRRFLAR